MMTHARGLTVYAVEPDTPAEPGASLFEFDLPGARLSLELTNVTWRAFSGEGSLLPALAGKHVAADAELLRDDLRFEPALDPGALALRHDLPTDRVEASLRMLAASGCIGWDPHDNVWFHRELPHDSDRVVRDNPRLKAARELADGGYVDSAVDGITRARSGTATYRVRLSAERADRCSCPWFLRYDGGRGPCKHVLAARLALEKD